MKNYFTAEYVGEASSSAADGLFKKHVESQYGVFRIDLTILHTTRHRNPHAYFRVSRIDSNPFIGDATLLWCPRDGCLGFARKPLIKDSFFVEPSDSCPVCGTAITRENGKDQMLYVVPRQELADTVARVVQDKNDLLGLVDIHMYVVKEPLISDRLHQLAADGRLPEYRDLMNRAFGDSSRIGGDGELIESVYYSAKSMIRDQAHRGLSSALLAFISL